MLVFIRSAYRFTRKNDYHNSRCYLVENLLASMFRIHWFSTHYTGEQHKKHLYIQSKKHKKFNRYDVPPVINKKWVCYWITMKKWVCHWIKMYHYTSFPATLNTLGNIPSEEEHKKRPC